MNYKTKMAKRVLEMEKSAIHEMTSLSKKYSDVAFLSWAKPSSGTPEFIKTAAVDAINKGLADGYSTSSGILELREAICDKLESFNKINASPHEIISTTGAIEGLAAAIFATIDPGDEVILPDPTYSTHIRQVLLASGIPVLVPTLENEGFSLDIDAIRDAITPKTKAILYCSPANPTGAVFSEKQLRQLADIALENNLVVITDEAYESFIFDDYKHFSIASIDEMKPRTISCFTFTKNYAMTGWRIGYLHAHEDLIPQITKAHIPLTICPPVISQYAALAALRGSQDCITKFNKIYLEARNLMCDRLDELSAVFDYQKPRGSYLMFPRILTDDGQDSMVFCKKLLHNIQVSTTPGIAFGPSGESHLRLSFCVPSEMINDAFDRMDNYFSKK